MFKMLMETSQIFTIFVLKHEFSVIGIAETNILKSNKDLYNINDNYTSVYSSKIGDKSKGSGLDYM